MEHLTEGWVKFRRFHCKDGFIDQWHGDTINNPNNDKEHQMCLNATATYYRLNGKNGWFYKDNFKGIQEVLHNLKEDFSAEEIWAEALKYS